MRSRRIRKPRRTQSRRGFAALVQDSRRSAIRKICANRISWASVSGGALATTAAIDSAHSGFGDIRPLRQMPSETQTIWYSTGNSVPGTRQITRVS